MQGLCDQCVSDAAVCYNLYVLTGELKSVEVHGACYIIATPECRAPPVSISMDNKPRVAVYSIDGRLLQFTFEFPIYLKYRYLVV